jgi:hypothetical protein
VVVVPVEDELVLDELVLDEVLLDAVVPVAPPVPLVLPPAPWPRSW